MTPPALSSPRRGVGPGALFRILIAGAIAALAGAAWYYSGQVLGPDAPPSLDEQPLYEVNDSSITVGPDPDAISPGVSALEWAGGYGEISERLTSGPDRVRRRFRSMTGSLPSGLRVSARPFAFAAEPKGALGLDYRTVVVHAPLGDCPAWRLDPNDSLLALGVASGAVSARDALGSPSWLVYVHGRGANRAQSLGVTPLFLRMGWTVLAITYRGDVGAPANHPTGYRLGETEWRDLEAAVRYALEHGAQRVEIFGMSMGGTITLEFLRHSPLAPRVMGVVLEAPVLRWRPVFDLAARERGVPSALTSLGMSIAAWRTGLDWSDLDQLAHAKDLHTPILVLHGDADPTVPFATSDLLSLRRPDLVTLVKVIGAGHSRCRNVDPQGYDAAIAAWTQSRLAAVAPRGAGAEPEPAKPASPRR